MNLKSIIKKSERYTKTDMVYLATGGFWLTLGQIISSGASILLSITFAHFLPKDTYGSYKYILSIGSLLAISTLTSLDTAVTQAVSRGKEGSVMLGLRTKIKWGYLGTILSVGVSGYYFLQGNIDLAIAFLIIAIFLPFTESFDIYNALLQGKKRFKQLTYCNITTQIIAAGSLIGALFFTKNILVLVGVYLISNTVLNIACFLWSIHTVQPNSINDPSTIPYGKHLSFIAILGIILAELDKILIFHFLGAAELAVYIFAIAPTDQLKGFLKIIQTLVFPRFAEQEKHIVRKNIFSKVFKLFMFVSIVVLGYIVVIPTVFDVFFKNYTEAVPYSQVASLSLIPIFISLFFYAFLESHSFKKELYTYNFINNGITIIILIPMIYYFGLWGAILSRVLIRTCLLSTTTLLVRKIPTT